MKIAKQKVILMLLLTSISGSTLGAKDKLIYPLDGNAEIQQYMTCFENFYLTPPEVIISRLSNYVSSHPQSNLADEALLKAGELAEKLRNYDEALNYYQRVVSEYPQAKKLEESFLWRNYISEVEISFINELYQYYEKYPTYSADLANVKIANCLRLQSKIDLAIETLKSVIVKYSNGFWEKEDLARIQKLEGLRTLPIYAAAWFRPHREAYLLLANLYQKKEEIDQAIQITTQFLEKFGKLSLFWEVKNDLADLYAEKNDLAKATEILEKTFREIQTQKNLNPKDSERLQKITQEKIKQFKIQ